MEKNTVVAIVLSTIVLIVFFVIQGQMSPPVQDGGAIQSEQTQTADPNILEMPESSAQLTDVQIIAQPTQIVSEGIQSGDDVSLFSSIDDSVQLTPQTITIDTEKITVVLTNVGGNMVSWKLKDQFDKDEQLDMIFSGSNDARTFSIAFGGIDAPPDLNFYQYNKITDYVVEFFRYISVFSAGEERRFRLTKRYEFKPSDYMFELTVTLDGGTSVSEFNFAGGNAYTLSFGPQIGPKFIKLDNNHEYREYLTYTNGKRKTVKPNEKIDGRPSWAAITGKYFAFIAVPYLAQYEAVFTETAEAGVPSASRFNIIRPAVSSSRVTDTYRFYLGPKSQDVLSVYNTGSNDFGLKDTNLTQAVKSRGFSFPPLERLLKWLLLLIYRIVPNYGVAIILLTLLIKILFFPLTRKSSEATLRMQTLSPKIKELQEKYKDNPQKLNVEMANFYKKEGYNPLSGCLPMLLQIPIFFAMYSLFNNHFDLRGAQFIPGWIQDLSVPEAIVNFPDGVRIPILGWTALRALPFIYVGSQLLYGKFTQTPGQQSPTQMKMILYVMPIAFFFILYNMPSGLLIYWIFSNVLTLVQQLIITKYNKAAPSQVDESRTTAKTVIAPPKKKKRK